MRLFVGRTRWPRPATPSPACATPEFPPAPVAHPCSLACPLQPPGASLAGGPVSAGGVRGRVGSAGAAASPAPRPSLPGRARRSRPCRAPYSDWPGVVPAFPGAVPACAGARADLARRRARAPALALGVLSVGHPARLLARRLQAPGARRRHAGRSGARRRVVSPSPRGPADRWLGDEPGVPGPVDLLHGHHRPADPGGRRWPRRPRA